MRMAVCKLWKRFLCLLCWVFIATTFGPISILMPSPEPSSECSHFMIWKGSLNPAHLFTTSQAEPPARVYRAGLMRPWREGHGELRLHAAASLCSLVCVSWGERRAQLFAAPQKSFCKCREQTASGDACSSLGSGDHSQNPPGLDSLLLFRETIICKNDSLDH